MVILTKKKILLILAIGFLAIAILSVVSLFALRMLLGDRQAQRSPEDTSAIIREAGNSNKSAADEAYAKGDREKALELYEKALADHKEADTLSGEYEDDLMSNETSDVMLQIEILNTETPPADPPKVVLPEVR